MNNQKGDAILFCVLILVALSGLLTLTGLRLELSLRQMEKRTELFLCVKEAKGELGVFLKTMGRLNWVLKNISRSQMVAVFIPYLWPYVGQAEELKKFVKISQEALLVSYQIKLADLMRRHCPLDPRTFPTPYELGADYGFSRTPEGAAKLKVKTWTYYFSQKPYLISLKVDATYTDAVIPKISYQAEEKMATLSSPLSSL